MPERVLTALLIALLGIGASLTEGCGGAQVRPDATDPGILELAATLGNRYVPSGTTSEMVARLRIDAHAVTGANRPAINVALVVDTSGSMEGQPIADARAATEALLDSLEPGDRLSVVVFHSETEMLLPSTVIDASQLDDIRQRIRRMEARGTTDLAGGLQAGLEEVTRYYDARGINRVVLLSDGVPNDGSMIRPLAQAAGERHIAVTALGLGLDYDEVLLGDVATASGGRFHYIADSASVASVFRDEVLRMSRTVARNIFVELRPGPGVTIQSVVGPAFTESNGRIYVNVGDLAEGDGRDLLVRMNVEGRRPGASVELMDAVMTFDDAAFDAGHFERRVFMSAHATEDEGELTTGRDESVEHDAARMTAAAVTVEAIRLARGGEVERARAILASATAEASVYASNDADMAARSESMRVLDSYLPAIAPSSGSSAPMAPPAVEAEVRSYYDEATSTADGY
jgi:Ca-activated chloride channel family protein